MFVTNIFPCIAQYFDYLDTVWCLAYTHVWNYTERISSHCALDKWLISLQIYFRQCLPAGTLWSNGRAFAHGLRGAWFETHPHQMCFFPWTRKFTPIASLNRDEMGTAWAGKVFCNRPASYSESEIFHCPLHTIEARISSGPMSQ